MDGGIYIGEVEVQSRVKSDVGGRKKDHFLFSSLSLPPLRRISEKPREASKFYIWMAGPLGGRVAACAVLILKTFELTLALELSFRWLSAHRAQSHHGNLSRLQCTAATGGGSLCFFPFSPLRSGLRLGFSKADGNNKRGIVLSPVMAACAQPLRSSLSHHFAARRSAIAEANSIQGPRIQMNVFARPYQVMGRPI